MTTSRVLVAGGATGIGRATVRAFRARGDSVLLADLDGPGAAAVCAEDLPGEACALGCDLSEPDAPAAAVHATVDAFGGLDAVIGNAARLRALPLAEWTPETWDHDLAVNLRAPFLLAQAAAPFLSESRGALVFTASTGAFRGHAGMPAYHASKGGLVSLVRSLADELSPQGVRVNAIAPGWVETPFNDAYWDHQSDPDGARKALEEAIPLRRQGTPEDISGVVLFLCSPAAAYMTGECLVVDGGYLAV